MSKKKKSKKSGVNQKKNNYHAKKQMVAKDFANAKNYAEEAEAVSNEVDLNVMPKKETEKIAKTESKKAETVSEKAEAETDVKSKKQTTKKSDKNKVPLWAKIVMIALSVILVLIITAMTLMYMLLSHSTAVFKGNPMDILISSELKKDENGQTNFLIFGTSEDAKGHGGRKFLVCQGIFG